MPRHGDPAAAVKKGTDGGAHGVLITAPSLGAFKQGVGMTRKRGTCVLVGLPPGEFPVPLFDVVANCITIRGSFVGTREDMAEALAFAAEGKVKADIELQPLSAINEIFDRLEHGDVPARVVLDFVGAKADDRKTEDPDREEDRTGARRLERISVTPNHLGSCGRARPGHPGLVARLPQG